MTDGPSDALHEQARDWGRGLLAASPWSAVADRITLLQVGPPAGIEGDVPAGPSAFWLTLDGAAARALPSEYRTPLTSDRAVHERQRAPGDLGRASLAITTDDSLHRLLQGTSRAAMEARWQARHAAVVHDRLRRGEQYALRANLLPDDAPERIVRSLWLEAVAASGSLDMLVVDAASGALPAGEAAAALCRLACFDDSGAYPPAAYLRVAARETRLGRRIATWLDDLPRAAGGDEAAARRAVSARDQVVEEARTVLAERYRSRPWLQEPEAYLLRPPR